MLLKITTTHEPARDLGFLLGKHPDRTQLFDVPFGWAHVFFPQACDNVCSVALVVDLDPVGLVRGQGEGDGVLAQYVNDRPYAASSFLAVAMLRVFSSAFSGRCHERPELPETAMPFEVHLPVVRCRAGGDMLRRCFEPLGYDVDAMPIVLDAAFPQWGESGYFELKLKTTARLRDVLTQLYILLPAIDGDKHYFVGDHEVQKLLDKSKHWIAGHPQREWLMSRYLKRQRSLVRQALEQLLEDMPDVLAHEEALDELESLEMQHEEAQENVREGVQEATADGLNACQTTDHSSDSNNRLHQADEKPLGLNQQRMQAVEDALMSYGVRSVADVGCGEGRLLGRLLKHRQFELLLGMDVSVMALERAAERLKLDRMPPLKRKRIELVQGSLAYRDARLKGFDAICAVEVIEHMELQRIGAFERVIFEFAQPPLVVITTPNAEFNIRYEGVGEGHVRHADHRFEWTRGQFERWAQEVAKRYGYEVAFTGIGETDPEVGASTQMGVFRK